MIMTTSFFLQLAQFRQRKAQSDGQNPSKKQKKKKKTSSSKQDVSAYHALNLEHSRSDEMYINSSQRVGTAVTPESTRIKRDEIFVEVSIHLNFEHQNSKWKVVVVTVLISTLCSFCVLDSTNICNTTVIYQGFSTMDAKVDMTISALQESQSRGKGRCKIGCVL